MSLLADPVREAEHRYLFDPLFYARVERAVMAVDADLYARLFHHLDPADRSLAVAAAAVGVVMSGLNPVTGEPT